MASDRGSTHQSAGRGARGRFGRPLAVALLALVWLAAPGGGARAHAEVIDTTPGDGSISADAPAAITITFNEPVGLGDDGIRVFDAAGRRVDTAPESLAGTTATQPLPVLADGWYLVDYRIVSADGHVVSAAATFGVGSADAASRAAVEALRGSAAPAHWLVRFTADLALLVAAGAAAALLLFAVRGRRAHRLFRAALPSAALATAAWWCIEAVAGGSAWIAGSASLLGALRAVLLAAAAICAARGRHRLAALLALLALPTMLVGGHPGATPGTVLLLGGHLVAAALWLGAAPTLWAALGDPEVDDAAALVAARRFSRAAAAAVVVAIGAGALLGWQLTDGLAGGVNDYALLLAAKLALAGAALAGGAVARRRLAGDGAPRRFLRRLFAVDAALLVAIAGLSAALTLGAPHQGHLGHEGYGRCGLGAPLGSVRLTMNPGRLGANLVQVTGAPTVEAARLRLVPPDGGGALEVPLERSSAAGAWQGSAVLPRTGAWRVTLVLQIDRFSEQRGDCALDLAP